MRIQNKVKHSILFFAAALVLGFVTWSLVQEAQERRIENQRKETQAAAEALMQNPEELYNQVVNTLEQDAALRKVDYKEAAFATTTMAKVAEILDKRALSDHLREVRESNDPKLKARSNQVIKAMQNTSEGVVADLGITPNDRYNYFLVSTDVTVPADARSVDEAVASFGGSFKLLCENEGIEKPFDCRADVNGQSIKTQYITLFPMKVGDDPTTYRLYGFLRASF